MNGVKGVIFSLPTSNQSEQGGENKQFFYTIKLRLFWLANLDQVKSRTVKLYTEPYNRNNGSKKVFFYQAKKP